MKGGGVRVKISVEVCDVCHNPDRKVKHWRIAAPDQRLRSFALCDEHGQAWAAILAQMPGGDVRRARKVATMADVAAAKKATRKGK